MARAKSGDKGWHPHLVYIKCQKQCTDQVRHWPWYSDLWKGKPVYIITAKGWKLIRGVWSLLAIFFFSGVGLIFFNGVLLFNHYFKMWKWRQVWGLNELGGETAEDWPLLLADQLCVQAWVAPQLETDWQQWGHASILRRQDMLIYLRNNEDTEFQTLCAW